MTMTDSEQAIGGRSAIQTRMVALKLDPLDAQISDVVKALSDAVKGGAEFVRTPISRTRVRVGLEMANGDRVSAEGATTADAVAALATRMETWPNA